MESIRLRYYPTRSSTSKKGRMQSLTTLLSRIWPSTPASGSLPQHQSQNSKAAAPTDICIGHPQSDPGGHKYIHWCIPHTNHTTRMFAVQTCSLQSDIDLFAALNAHYRHAKNKLGELFSLRRPVALHFVKVSRF